MMARAEAERELEDESIKSEAELLDVLYEVLAQGVPPGSQLTSAEVERFLHEHARNRKTSAEMLAFFERHSLPTSPGEYGANEELRELASGLHRERGPLGVMPLEADAAPLPPPTESGPVRRALPSTEQALVEDSSTVRTRLTHAQPNKSQRGLLSALLALTVGSLVGFGLSFQRGSELEGDLQRAHLQLRATDDALTALEERSEGLRGELRHSEAERAALTGRFESFAADAQRAREAEEAVLKRMLGKRYETLRAQALSTPVAAPAPVIAAPSATP